MWFLFSLLRPSEGLRVCFRSGSLTMWFMERETQAAESWRIASRQLDLINWISDDAVFHTIHRYASRGDLANVSM